MNRCRADCHAVDSRMLRLRHVANLKICSETMSENVELGDHYLVVQGAKTRGSCAF